MLRIEGLTAGYDERVVVRDVHLEVPEGEIALLAGHNASGKSTVLKTIIGLLRPLSGQILLEGQSVLAWSTTERCRRGLAYLAQGQPVFPRLTVEENLLLSCLAIYGRRGRATYDANVDNVVETFPMIGRYLHTAAGKLSGGEQQQVGLGAVLITSPRVILLDEPSARLSSAGRESLRDALGRAVANHQASLLVVEHRVNEFGDLADRLYILRRGEVKYSGTPSSWLRESGRPESLD